MRGFPAAPTNPGKVTNAERSGAAHAPQPFGAVHTQLLQSIRALPLAIELPLITYLATAHLADDVHDRRAVERLVLRYLQQHPAAADSIEGVRLWWLRGVDAVSQTALNTVLDELCQRGWLVTRGDRPDTRIYSLNERELEAVERFLGQPQDPGERSDG